MTDDATVKAAAVDELPWLHAHEYVPWGVHVAAAQELRHSNPTSHASEIHFGLAGAKAALVNDHIAVIVGGRDHPVDHYAYASRVDLFDTRHDKWLTNYDVKGELLRRIGHTVVSVGGRRAVMFGGEAIDESGVDCHCLNDCFEITFAQNVASCSPIISSETPAAPEASPSERAWHGACSIKLGGSDAMLVLGGRDASGKFLGDLWALVMEEATDGSHVPVSNRRIEAKWTQLAPTGTSPLPLAFHSAVSVENGAKVVVVGGRQAARGAMTGTVHVLDIAANVWSQVALSATSPAGWTARSGLTALEVCVPLDVSTGALAQIRAKSQSQKLDDSAPDMPENADSTNTRRILIFGGFSERAPATDPTRFALLDKDTGHIRELHAPSVGLTAHMGQASLASADAKSLYVFGGVDARTRQFVATTNAIHFWKPQPGDTSDGSDSDNNANAIRTKSYDNGDEYAGGMDALGVLRQGHGRCVYHDNGGTYDGEWRDDMRCGQGVMTYTNGDTYSGQWEADTRHGFGILEIQAATDDKARTETRYDGAWEHDRRAGKGIAYFSDGSKLEGEWRDGEMVPESGRLEKYDDGNGVCTYTGGVLDGLPHGHGTSQHARETYVGEWKHGKRSGHGVLTLLDGTTYTGEWKNGKRNGFGTCAYARSREQYEGKWVGGVRCGRGVCHYANGAQYDGEWRDDKCHGVGKYTFPDGTFYEGNWHDNKFCGDGALVLDLDEPLAIE